MPNLLGGILEYKAGGKLTASQVRLPLISRRKTRVEAIFKNIGQILVSVVTKHCQPPVSPSLGGDARVPRPGSRVWLPSVCAPCPAGPRDPPAPRPRWPGGSAGSVARGRGPGHPALHFLGWGERLGGAADGAGCPSDAGPAHPPTRLPAPEAAGSALPGHEPCPPGGGRRPAATGTMWSVFCGLSASFPDPPFHAPWPNRHRPGTQREAPPYLVLERKGKGYPQMPAALGHRPAVFGPRPGAVPTPAGRWRRRAAPRGDARSRKQTRRFRYLGVGVFFCVRAGGDGAGEVGVTGSGRRRGRARKEEEREKKKTKLFF